MDETNENKPDMRKSDEVTVQKKCDEINDFLEAVRKTGLSKMSIEDRRELLEIQKKLALINTEDEEKYSDNHSETKIKQSKKEIKEERERFVKSGGLPRDKKYLDLNKAEDSSQCYDPESSSGSDSVLSKIRDNQKEIKRKLKKYEKSKRGSLPRKSSAGSAVKTEHVPTHKSRTKKKKGKKQYYDSSSESESSSAESSKSVVDHRHSRKGSYKSRDYLKMMAERLDNRIVPKFDKFKEGSGQSLEEFLEGFEEYCMENIKGDHKGWLRLLEEQLTGDILKAFQNFREFKDSYPEVKDKLLTWYDSMDDMRKKEYKKDFESVEYEKD